LLEPGLRKGDDCCSVKKITVTIDTCCINAKQESKALNKLEEWNRQGLIEIYRTEIMDEELKGEKRRKKADKLLEDKGARVWQYTDFHHRDFGGEDPKEYPFHELIDIVFPDLDKLPSDRQDNKIRDVEHLSTHYQHHREYFVTIDKDFTRKRDELKERYSIIILTPEECVEEIQHNI
jgi:hypothetical protein